MSTSKLLHSQLSDEELALGPVQQHRYHNDYGPIHGDDSDESDGEVPASLLVEEPPHREYYLDRGNPLHYSQDTDLDTPPQNDRPQSTMHHMSAYDRAIWRWTNVQNLDVFFQRVYDYYQGKGIYCILLGRLLNLLHLAFLLSFSTFLIGCIDYRAIPNHHSLSEVVSFGGLSSLPFPITLVLTIFVIWWILQAIRFVWDISSLMEIHDFYLHLLGIPDQDMQTVSWDKVVKRMIAIRNTNPNTSERSSIKITVHEVANRIMRRENYMIALFNKEVLDMTIPLPYLRHKHIFTRDLEWNLSYCVQSYVFDARGQIRKRFMKQENRPLLVAGLRKRFVFMGIVNLVFAPFILVYLFVFFVFRYFEEYHKNPSELGSRAYTPFAKWKFREFNELPHFFHARLCQSLEPANRYLNQFPKEKTVLVARFVSFVAGAFAGVLGLLSLFDSEALLNFEISPNGTVLFYLGIFGTVFAVSRGMIPDEHLVFEPKKVLAEVVEHTHYLPIEWRGKLHTEEVRAQFCQLFDFKVGMFFQEVLSVVFTPLVLLYSLPRSTEAIVDFFREFTVHVEGTGYVCSFAQFDFARHGNVRFGVPTQVHDDHLVSRDGKMEKSFLNFKTHNPEWMPNDEMGSIYLSRVAAFQQTGPRKTTMLNKYGVTGVVPSHLGDSFVGSQQMGWQEQEHGFKPDNEDEDDEEEDEEIRQPGVTGLLNQFYTLNNPAST
ncbi:autophagy protein Apg9-domain-containing protein [Phycomyces nitens]|nr:autophagy protein Apg9-domain-containing protein [Phycomyces nitens]